MTSASAPGPAGIWRRIRLRDLVVFTLPVLLLVGWLYASALGKEYRTLQWNDWWTERRRVYHHFGAEWRGFRDAPKAIALERDLDPLVPDGEVLRLDLKRSEWDLVGRDPQAAFGHDFDAAVLREGTLLPVRIRIRGDTSAHWTHEKHSFTLMTQRDKLYRGYRRLGFTGKYVLPQFVTARLAKEFDLLAPECWIAEVYLNDRFYGAYRAVEVLDEEFLRRHGRMPGNLFRGDTAERGEVFHGVDRRLFRNPYIWERAAEDHASAEEGMQFLEQMLLDLNDTSPAARAHLRHRFDLAEIGRLVALMLESGDLYHLSDIHNQFWYHDSGASRLHPVPWDVYLRGLDEVGDWKVNLGLAQLLRDPDVMEGALRFLADQRNAGLVERIEKITRDADAARRSALDYDRLREGSIVSVGTVDEVLDIIRRNDAILRRWTDDARIAFAEGGSPDGTRVLDFETRGLVGADLTGLVVEGAPGWTGPAELVLDSDRDGRISPEDLLVACDVEPTANGARIKPSRRVAMQAGVSARTAPVVADPLHFRVYLRTGSALAEGAVVRPELVNRVTGAPAEVVAWPRGAAVSPTESWHPWDLREPPREVVRLTGDMHLDRDLVIPPGSRLVVEPGTTLRIAKGVSIFAYGPVEARGTEAAPISFEPADPELPWGVLAVLGRGADGTELSHCRFFRGSGARFDGQSFSGMVSVRLTQGVKVTDCEFRENRYFDDAFHSLQAECDLLRCRFIDANSDACDFDEAGGSIRSCRFERPGNDAIDLMTSAPVIEGNVMIGSLDKGISVGEGSAPLVVGNAISGCNMGMEVKDGSAPIVLHTHISGCKTGIRQRTKNWRYGAGGFVHLVHSVVTANRTDLETDAASRVLSVASVVGTVSAPEDAASVARAELVCDALLASAGFRAPPGHGAPGLIDGRVPAERVARVAEMSFTEDAGDLRDGWTLAGEVLHLSKRDHDLRAELTAAGSISCPVDWKLPGNGRRHLVIAEVSSEELAPIEFTVWQGGRGTNAAGQGSRGLANFEWIVVEVESGADVTGLKLATTATGRHGNLRLHRVMVYDVPMNN